MGRRFVAFVQCGNIVLSEVATEAAGRAELQQLRTLRPVGNRRDASSLLLVPKSVGAATRAAPGLGGAVRNGVETCTEKGP